METLKKNVSELNDDERRSLENALKIELLMNQRIIINVISIDGPTAENIKRACTPTNGGLPDWCDVYEGLSEEEIDDVESVSLERSDMTRPTE